MKQNSHQGCSSWNPVGSWAFWYPVCLGRAVWYCGVLLPWPHIERTSAHAQACPTFQDPNDCSPPGSSVHGILQARILECFAISFSRGSSQPRDRTHISYIGRQILPCLSHQGGLHRGHMKENVAQTSTLLSMGRVMKDPSGLCPWWLTDTMCVTLWITDAQWQEQRVFISFFSITLSFPHLQNPKDICASFVGMLAKLQVIFGNC